ncbi:MAG: oligoendopeptidase F [Eubacteriales bacterium]
MQEQVMRKDVDKKYKWSLEDIYPSVDKFKSDLELLKNSIPSVGKLKDTMLNSANDLLAALSKIDELSLLAERLYTYSKMKRDEDNTDPKFQALTDQAYSTYVKLSGAASFINPTLLSADEKLLLSYLEENSELKEKHDFYILDLIRRKKHVLSDKEELLLSKSADFSSGARDIFTMLNNADLSFGSITDDKGEEIELTHGRFITLMHSSNRFIRKNTFETYYKTFEKFKNTLATTYATSVKKDVFYAQAKNFNSAIERSLFSDNVPVSLYDRLISIIHKNLPAMYKYISLRKEILSVPALHMYDVYAPLVKTPETKFSYEQSCKMVVEGLSILGDEYLSTLNGAFKEGWIDVVETKGKTSGAYSWGVYGVHPFVLLNHRDDLDSVFTIAHEMGHAMHSFYSNKTQAYPKSGYTIFVAEVASTVNEILLTLHLLKTVKDLNFKKYILNHYLDQFRTTVFRQVMFAEFEKISHKMSELGTPLTADSLSSAYGELNAKYYGSEVTNDEQIKLEWSRIPHFYNAFYVYKYATGFSSAVSIVENLLTRGEKARNQYIDFLKSGGSDYPLNQLKKAGIDLSSGAPIEICMNVFSKTIDEFKNILNINS